MVDQNPPECPICQDIGLVYVAEYLGFGRIQLAMRPCFRCAHGFRLHGEPGSTCLIAERSRKNCPYCGAGPDGKVPDRFSGAEDQMPRSQSQLTAAEAGLFQAGRSGDVAPLILARHGYHEPPHYPHAPQQAASTAEPVPQHGQINLEPRGASGGHF